MRTSHGLENADLSSGIWCWLVRQKRSNVSEKAAASIFRVKDKDSRFPQNYGKNLLPIHSVQSHKAVIIMKHLYTVLQSHCNVRCMYMCIHTHTHAHIHKTLRVSLRPYNYQAALSQLLPCQCGVKWLFILHPDFTHIHIDQQVVKWSAHIGKIELYELQHDAQIYGS